jgi:hypothetical protein
VQEGVLHLFRQAFIKLVFLGDFVPVKVSHEAAEVGQIGGEWQVSLTETANFTSSGSRAVGVVIGLSEDGQQIVEGGQGDISGVFIGIRAQLVQSCS